MSNKKFVKNINFLQWVKNNTLYVIIGIVLSLYICTMIYSLLFAFSATIKPYSEFIDDPMNLFTSNASLKNWIDALNDLKVPKIGGDFYYFEEMFFFALIYSVGCSLIGTATQCVVAYLVSKYPFRFGKIVYAIVIVTMILPVVGSLPSELQILETLGLFDTIYGIYIMKANFLGMNFLIFYAIFKSISWTYAESAFIDGASHFTVMLRIMLPLVKTTFLAVFMLNFIAYWNDYQGPMLYLPSYPTISYGMYYMKVVATSTFGREPMQLTGCMLMTLPIVILFIIFQKRLMGNLTVGGIKG